MYHSLLKNAVRMGEHYVYYIIYHIYVIYILICILYIYVIYVVRSPAFLADSVQSESLGKSM